MRGEHADHPDPVAHLDRRRRDDLPSSYQRFGGVAISAAINRYIHIGINRVFRRGKSTSNGSKEVPTPSGTSICRAYAFGEDHRLTIVDRFTPLLDQVARAYLADIMLSPWQPSMQKCHLSETAVDRP